MPDEVNVVVDEKQPEIAPEYLIKKSGDKMEAYLTLCPTDKERVFTKDEIFLFLQQENIVFGVDQQQIKKMIDQPIYFTPVLIAKGLYPVNGTDGRFQFLFDLNVERKPKILADGSVDYRSLVDVEGVEAGIEIVRYTPATEGKNGLNIEGTVLSGIRGRDLAPLKGKGFFLSADNCVYTTAIAGKIDFENGKLTVSNLLSIHGNVDLSTGDINFVGDVTIQGSVIVGMQVKASGSITVNGYVEAATLTAGRDIILKNGMQGGGRGIVTAEGNVSGKFFEQTVIRAKGSINANAIMNCDIESEDEIVISGKFGVIIGGITKALSRIEATIIGNMAEIKTNLFVGLDGDSLKTILTLDQEIGKLTTEIEKLEGGIKQLDVLIQRTNRQDFMQQKMALLRTKIAYNTKISEDNIVKDKLIHNLEKSTGASILVRKAIYPGTSININGKIHKVLDSQFDVTYKVRGVDICMFSNSEL